QLIDLHRDALQLAGSEAPLDDDADAVVVGWVGHHSAGEARIEHLRAGALAVQPGVVVLEDVVPDVAVVAGDMEIKAAPVAAEGFATAKGAPGRRTGDHGLWIVWVKFRMIVHDSPGLYRQRGYNVVIVRGSLAPVKGDQNAGLASISAKNT